MSQGLDRGKPLWELWVVEGLEGNRFAIISKIHHCMIDGVAGAELMAMLLNFGPDRTVLEARTWEPQPTPSGAELIVAESARLTRSVLDQAKGLFDGLPGLAGRLAGRVQQAGQTLRSGWLTPSTPTPLNERIGPNRRFAWLDTPLETIKGARRATGASINDLVLTVVTGAIRSFMIEHRGFEPKRGGYRAMVPVSVREGAAEQLGNQVAMWLVELPIGEADPLARLAAISAETTRLKESNEAEGATALVDAASGTPVTLLSLGLKAAAERRPFNMTITNVPGPQFPLYLLDAQMEATYPLVPLWHHHGLSIALFSYAGTINWGVVADWDLVPDLDAFIDCLDRSVAELVEATG
jgi:WS/DGAT/MGAT family acyltransferase